MDPIFKILVQSLAGGEKVVLATLVRQWGSTPRSVGARCLVHQDGRLTGTIGGGRLEGETVQAAGEILVQGKNRLIHFELQGKEVAEVDMICGGKVDVYLEGFTPKEPDIVSLYWEVLSLLKKGEKGLLATLLLADAPGQKRDNLKALFGTKGLVAGKLLDDELTARIGVSWGQGEFRDEPQTLDLEHQGQKWGLYLEPLLSQETVYLLGAGHIARKLVPLLKLVHFKVVVVDDRPQFANYGHFPEADEILVLPFEGVLEALGAGGADYLVIVTRGHLCDHAVLEQALHKEFAYIGMIGSRRKRDLIYKDLLAKGISGASLDKVHAPIGLSIQAETPEEIAISIAAELIEVRAKRRPH
jgi:xanthine dehydrogenase accessory factor